MQKSWSNKQINTEGMFIGVPEGEKRMEQKGSWLRRQASFKKHYKHKAR